MSDRVAEWLPLVLRFGTVTTVGRAASVCVAWRNAVDADTIADVVWSGGVSPLQQGGFLDVALGISSFKRNNPELAQLLPDRAVGAAGVRMRADSLAAVLHSSSPRASGGAARLEDGEAGGGGDGGGAGAAAGDTASAIVTRPPSDSITLKPAEVRRAEQEAREAEAALDNAADMVKTARGSQRAFNPNIKALHGSRMQRGKLMPALVAVERCFLRVQPHNLAEFPLDANGEAKAAPAVRAMETALLASPLDKAVVLSELLDTCPDAHTAAAAFVCLTRRLCMPRPHRQAEMALSWWRQALLEPAPDNAALDKVPQQLLLHTVEALMAKHQAYLTKCVRCRVAGCYGRADHRTCAVCACFVVLRCVFVPLLLLVVCTRDWTTGTSPAATSTPPSCLCRSRPHYCAAQSPSPAPLLPGSWTLWRCMVGLP